MGTIHHNAIVVVASDHDDRATKVREAVLEVAGQMPQDDTPWTTDWTQLVSPLCPALTNGYVSFFIAPDGSKEWWDTSDAGDEFREKVRAVLDEHGARYVEVGFGERGLSVSDGYTTWESREL